MTPTYIMSIILIVTSILVQISLSKSTYSRQQARNFLANKTLVVSVLVREPFVIFNKNGPGRITKANVTANENNTDGSNVQSSDEDEADITDPKNYSGVAVEVLNRLSDIFHFRYYFVRPNDNLFGSQRADGSWSGLVGDVYYNVSDIGLTALSITLERTKAVEFSRAYFVETTSILIPIPEEEKNYFAIFQPFSMAVWLVLLATILGLILLVQVMLWFQELKNDLNEVMSTSNKIMTTSASPSRIKRMITKHEENHWLKRFYYSVSCVVNILLVRDIENPPKQNPVRIMVCLWWLCTIVIVNIYSGILFGQLVIPRLPSSIDTLEELANQNKIKWSVTRGSALYDLFERSAPDSIYAKIGKTMENVTTVDDGIERTLNNGWAFIREKSILAFKISEYHTRFQKCKMKLAQEEFFSVGFGIAFKKGAPYVGAFNSAIGMMIENGFVARWQSKYWPTRNVYTQCDTGPSEGEPLSMKHFLSIFLVCSIIILTSMGILLYQSTHEHIFVGRMKPLIIKAMKKRRNDGEIKSEQIQLA